jgi:hypothetical protein
MLYLLSRPLALLSRTVGSSALSCTHRVPDGVVLAMLWPLARHHPLRK